MDAFKRAIEVKDIDAVARLLADDIEFSSPAVHKPYVGKDATLVILRAVARVFEDFAYTLVLEEGSDSVLVFQARVGDRQLEGADFVHVDEAGKIDRLRVMIRPLSGLNALVAAMAVAIDEVMAELAG
jgi:SnoaL-like domain